MIRLRQVALAADDLDPAVDELCALLDAPVVFRDPGVAEFGLRNALVVVGDQFVEVVAPDPALGEPGATAAGRLLHKRRTGDGPSVTGYMAIYEVDDLDAREAAITAAGVRIVWRGDVPAGSGPAIRGRHLHPRDVGGAIVSVDEPVPPGSWRWAGPAWRAHHGSTAASAIAGVVVAAADPAAMRDRWRSLGLDAGVRFAAAGPAGKGIDAIELVATDRERAGEERAIGGVAIRFV